MKKIIYVCILGIFMNLYAATNKALVGSWQLQNNKNISINFAENNQIYGFLGVNHFSAIINTRGNKVKFNNITYTLMSGAQEDAKIENEVLDALQNATRFDVHKNTLTLFLKDDKTLKFNRATITNIQWNLVALNTNQAIINTPFNANIQFSDDKKAFGFNGVNRFIAEYDMQSNKLSLKDIARTKMMSQDKKTAEFEITFTNLLQQVAKFSLIGTNLQLLDKEGKILLIFAQG